MRIEWSHFIDGKWSAPAAATLQERNPRSGETTFRIARGTAQDVDAAVAAARAALPGWRNCRPIERGRVLIAIADCIRKHGGELAQVETVETGRPLAQSLLEVEVAAKYFEFYGGLVNALEGEAIDLGPDYHCYTRREPFGAIATIVPWNVPINQAARSIAPALAVGNTVVAKPSEFTSVSILRLAGLATEECALPPGVLNVVTGTGAETGSALTRHPGIAKIAFTGSLRAGREVGKVAAERIVPVTLELGGKSPDIVFADADLQVAIPGVLRGFTVNAGQACVAGARVLVERSICEQFSSELAAAARALKLGGEGQSDIGPIITEAQFHKVQEYLEIARREGATVLAGGCAATRGKLAQGWFIEPTVYTDVAPESRIAREEIFGPIGVVIPFDSEEDAIAMANDTEYGLAAGVWTRSLTRAHRVAACLEAGQVYVNEFPSGGVETPFGGYKQSGIGREKGRAALHHYTQLKTVIVKLS